MLPRRCHGCDGGSHAHGPWGAGRRDAAGVVSARERRSAQAQPAAAAQGTAARDPECIQPKNAWLSPRFHWRDDVLGTRLREA
ncbi:hypothetical protein ACH5A3_20075 [Streptomyces echinatus]|uniref:hypothetical protein n=1 Tax=Streptomyces echinatus TaxID=67293 RepID=UPI003787FCB0